ncbi:RimJ/RimL family protein N-acetyltransferase [Paenibacillus amylolyticus]|uniref:RimJ/RimL family protein N-acetyltransferase n=1 Tax=Paenibacillus amylolyticus TaxID=1451 RepID=A0AAP5H1L0_PAEAM|nr:GNAT family N-acetyltransferase [Paenibacillus amylolyticus]MDR6723610.1 RimJ/RimL family protein N-acetyltransferase [Paenibacillus amylolyticus]
MPFKDAFITFPKLETERFILRELRSEDAKDYHIYLTDDEVIKYWGYKGPKNIETASKIFKRFENAFTRKEMITWGIATKEDDKIIGTCILNDFVRASMVGFVQEGLLRDYIFGEIITDTLVFSILKKDLIEGLLT